MSEKEGDNTKEISIKEQLLEAYQSGDFLDALYHTGLSSDLEEDCLAQELASLHNEGSINLVDSFSELKKADSGFMFFSIRAMFEKALPDLASDVSPVVNCVRHLVREAGQDLAAGTTVDYFIKFLAADPDRLEESLAITKANPELSDLLPATLIAGANLDFTRYLGEVLRLIKSENIDTRKQAIFSLSRFDWDEENAPTEEVYLALEQVRDSYSDDDLLAATARTAASFLKHDQKQEKRLVDLIDSAIAKGGDQAIWVASSLLTYADEHMPDALIARLLQHLKRVNAEHNGTIDQIDHGIQRLIAIGKINTAIEFLEEIVEEKGKDLEPSAFDSTLHDIQRNPELLNKATTRWLLNGNAALCRAAEFLIGSGRRDNFPVEADPAEIDASNMNEVIFLARKITGHFFMNSVSAASMLLSLLQLAQDNMTRTQVGKLLMDPILMNFPGEARSFVNGKKDSCSAEVQEVLRQIDVALEEYFDALRSNEDLPELLPSDAQREAYQRHSAREMAESFKEAEMKSVFLGLVTKQTLLYGRSSITYVQDGQGTAHRQEVPLQEHSIEFEIPRILQLDPLGLEYQLAVYKSETRQQ